MCGSNVIVVTGCVKYEGDFMERQPLLHDLLVCLRAPTQAWSDPDGQMRPDAAGLHGVFHADVRVLSGAVLTLNGEEPEVIATGSRGVADVRITALARGIDGPGADPTNRVDRLRSIAPGTFEERVVLSCSTASPVRGTIRVALSADFLPMDAVKMGRFGRPHPATADGDGLAWAGDGEVSVRLHAPGAAIDLSDPGAPAMEWDVEARTGVPAEVGWSLVCTDTLGVVMAAPADAPMWSRPEVRTADQRIPDLLERSLSDLSGLRMSSSYAPGEVFLAAGAPWFFTLFGRDSIWAARMMLPLGTELAAGTLRTLAAAQGRAVVPASEEQPGRILHEVRRASLVIDGGVELPPLYYGTIDATPLWICLLADAWRWGLPSEEVEELLPALEAALSWMADYGDADGDGFLEYIDSSGHGLANQGWKDSGDSVQWRDGRLASGTIALCEVQGYAHEAAMAGADLLEAFGRPAAQRWRTWAGQLADRFREKFWVSDDVGRYPAIALDGDKDAVDTLTSNIGHLLGTGLLDAREEALVADRLTSPAMASGFGLRTLAEGSAGYWELRYHGGAVWPHDTAIAIHTLARSGFGAQADSLAQALLAAAPAFGYRLPELFSGDARGRVPRPVPYPASCRPQSWAAASAVAILSASLGLDPDVPGGTLTVRPTVARAIGVRGLRLAGRDLEVDVDAVGGVRVKTDAPVRVIGAAP